MSTRTRNGCKSDGVVTLLEILADMRASPDITAWDDAFCDAIERSIRELGSGVILSDIEVLILIEMRRRLLGVVLSAPTAADVVH